MLQSASCLRAVVMTSTAIWWTCAVCPPAAADFLAITYSNQPAGGAVLRINEANGDVSTVGFSGVVLANDLARGPNGIFYTSGITAGNFDRRLFTIDPLTGIGTPGPKLDLPGSEPLVDAMAFSPSGELLVMDFNDNLYKVDLSSGQGAFLSHVGALGSPIGINAMAFSANGILYGWGVERLGLHVIDPATGAFTDVSSAAGPSALIQGMDFASNGILYGGYNDFRRINTSTGVATFQPSDTISNIRGLAYIPEASSLLLTSLAAIGVLGVGARNRAAVNRVMRSRR